MLFSSKKPKSVGKHFILQDKEKEMMVRNINKIIGQLETIKKDVMTDNACDESLTQILAIKGGVEKVGRELVGKGILECLSDYSNQELELIIKNLFKLT
jgi:DNA-binding FrmR family transcriptional regulator